MTLKVVPLRPEEIHQLVESSKRYSVQELERLLKLPFVDIWVLKTAKGELLGYAVLWKFKPEVELHWIEIFVPFRGKGLSKTFLGQILEHYRLLNYEKLLLEVSENNPPALRLYKNFAPKLVGFRRSYYSDGSNALLFEIPLKLAKTHNFPKRGAI